MSAFMKSSMKKCRYYFRFLLTSLTVIVLTSCGGGGGGATGTAADPQTTVQASVVEGIAAAGAPLTGFVSLRDSMYLDYSSATSKKPVTAPINQDGTFSISVAGLKAPFIIRAVDNSGNILYSFAKAPGTANINPLTNLAVAVAAGATDVQDLNDLFISHNSASMADLVNALNQVKANISSSLQPLLSLYGEESVDPFSGTYLVNSQGLDGLFDDVSFSVSGGNVTITRNDTDTAVFSSSLRTLDSSTNRAGLNITNLPTPTSYLTPGNAVLTLQVQGNLPQGTLIKYVTFSIQLPLGVTVLTDNVQGDNIFNSLCISCHSDPSSLSAVQLAQMFNTDHTGVSLTAPPTYSQLELLATYINDPQALNAVINTVTPIGTAAGANVYPAPSLSATNNILSITMSSLAGFNTGEFLTLRLIVPSSTLITSTTADSFSITTSQFYSDLYKLENLKSLTITPVSIVY
jgi:hypothetical protein